MASSISEREETRHEGRASLAARVSREGSPMGEEPGDPAAGAGSLATVSARAVALPPTPSSMALPVTRHAQISTVPEYQYLLCGIDTLDLGLFIVWDRQWPRTLKRLDRMKQAAQRKNGITVTFPSGRDFLVYPGGKGQNYRFHLACREYQLYLGKSATPNQTPNGYASLHAKALWHSSLNTLLDQVRQDLAPLGGRIAGFLVSRCDLAADFLVPGGLTFDFLREHQVSRSRVVRLYLNEFQVETYMCGDKTAPVKLRIYDKGKELAKSGKEWFLDFWGLASPHDVWRVEFELHRPVIKRFGISTVEDLQARLAGLWQYFTVRWYSLRLPDHGQTDRRTVHPWWRAVQECADRLGGDLDVSRNCHPTVPASAQWYLAHIAGCLPGFAVRHGFHDREQAIAELNRCLLAHVEPDDFSGRIRKLTIQLGREVGHE